MKKQRKRKIHSKQSSWNDAKNKQLRESGKGNVGLEKPKMEWANGCLIGKVANWVHLVQAMLVGNQN